MTDVIKIEVTKEILNEVLAATKTIMLQYPSLRRSNLVDSLEWTYRNNAFMLLAYDYFKWVDTGRKPRARKVPVQALIKWLQRKRIKPGYKQTYTSIAFAIREAIYKSGISPKPYTQQIIGASIELLSEELAVKLSIQIADEISKQLTFNIGVN